MKLNEKQQRIVTENIGLVGKVIQDKVHDVNRLCIYTYDDIFQIGCIGLCKAAYTDKGGCFSTYAYRLIWNEICTALIYSSKRSTKEISINPEIMTTPLLQEQESFGMAPVLWNILDRAEATASGVTAKGIRALRLMHEGYTCREIGAQMGVSPNNVSAWVSKARQYLQADQELMELKHLGK